MTREADELLKRALALPTDDRVALAGSLLSSVDEADLDVREAWDEEVSHRIEELDSGKAKTVPWQEIRRRIAAKLGNDQ
jgi:putative addiction module component (TIGR02574 family)